MDHSSKYDSATAIAEFREDFRLTLPKKESEVIIDPVGEGECVTIVNLTPPHYFYMYGAFFKAFNLWLPFTSFEMAILRVLNVAPTQLSPNGWAYVKCFEVLCSALELSPSTGVFFYFYYVKSLTKGKAVTLTSQANRGLFTLYASNFKNYQNTFLRIRHGPGLKDLMYDEMDQPLFPFYWTEDPRAIKGVDETKLSESELETLSFLDNFHVMDPRDILDWETDFPSLIAYISKLVDDFALIYFCFLSAKSLTTIFFVLFCFAEKMKSLIEEEWMSFLARTKQKKGDTDVANVDPLAPLVVGENKRAKRRRRGEDDKPAMSVKLEEGAPSHSEEGQRISVDVGRSHKPSVVAAEASRTSPEIEIPNPAATVASTPPPISTPGNIFTWGKKFDPISFINNHLVLKDDCRRFESMDMGSLRKMALGYELKSLVLNQVLSGRQEKDVKDAKETLNSEVARLEREQLAVVDQTVADHEKVVQDLKDKHKKECENLEDQLGEMTEARNVAIAAWLHHVKEELIARRLFKRKCGKLRSDVDTLQEEAQEMEEEIVELKEALASKFVDGFNCALAQMKILFPDLDPVQFAQADFMKKIEGGKLVPRVGGFYLCLLYASRPLKGPFVMFRIFFVNS
jgi:hypothetical protein